MIVTKESEAPSFYERASEYYPPKPTITPGALSDLAGKVYIITGGYSGIGFETVKALYGKNATVYIAGRSPISAENAMSTIKSEHPTSNGALHFLRLDLCDLLTIGPAVENFLTKESRLDILWLNAGVMIPPAGSKTKQDYELQLGTNVLGHFLFAKELAEILSSTAKTSPPKSVRIIWVSSNVHHSAPKGGMNYDAPNSETGWSSYGQSKAGGIILGREFQRRYPGVLSISCNPGHLRTGLQRHMSKVVDGLVGTFLFKQWYGGCSLLYAGFEESLKGDDYLIPWGRIGHVRPDVWDADGKKLWEWCETEVAKHA